MRYVALGDSFTEGVGDARADGSCRGWADRVAEGLAAAHGGIEYANLAIRGRLLDAIIEEQLPAALALEPTLLSFNGGGNDMLRPGTRAERLIARYREVIARVRAAGVPLLLISGGNPTHHLPRRERIEPLGDALTAEVTALAAELALPFADNWSDPVLTELRYWSPDRLHLNEHGHLRVAERVLRTLGEPVPASWSSEAPPMREPGLAANTAYTARYVLPWIGRRLTGRSSGDGRSAKHPSWVPISA